MSDADRRAAITARLANLGISSVRQAGKPVEVDLDGWDRLLDLAELGRYGSLVTDLLAALASDMAEHRIVLHGASWAAYDKLRRVWRPL